MALLSGVEGAGIARATQKVSPAGNSEVFPVLIPCGSRRELDSAVEKRIGVKNLAKPCETNVKSRNFYLQNLAKQVFAKLAKHNLRNLAKQCKTLIAKVAKDVKVAKVELHCETMIQNH